jgi:3-hydroxyisobutyrate dehydrogenase-like beta-hydroxyacid dehydrogenase
MRTTLGLLHPGEMGSAIGAALVQAGHPVIWVSAGRSAATAQRAIEAGLVDVGTVDRLVAQCDVLFSVCPPHAAMEVARTIHDFDGIFLEANAVSPRAVREIAATVGSAGASVVDGAIIGPPPRTSPTAETRLYVAGAEAPAAVRLFDSTPVDVRVIDGPVGAASALKMAYAAWTKGTAALVLAIRALARTSGVETDLLREWAESLPDLPVRTLQAARSAGTKGWRWVGEMEEIAQTFADADLPDGFHQAAAEIYRRSPRLDQAAPALELVIEAVRHPAGADHR